jgi:hypothetical protein
MFVKIRTSTIKYPKSCRIISIEKGLNLSGLQPELLFRRALYVFQGKVLEKINEKAEVKIAYAKSSL